MPYLYRPLDHAIGEIRLLSIPTGSDGIADAEEPLQCSLEYVPSRFGLQLDEHQITNDSPWEEYDALSYEWGIKEPKRSVLLDDEPFGITPNLFGALHRVQQAAHDENKQWIRLWVDAICIDQTNVEERNVQVPRMRHIYSFATIVYCYLTPYSLSPNSPSAKDTSLNYDDDVDVASELIVQMWKINYSNTREISSSWKLAIIPQWPLIVLATKRTIVLAGRNMVDFDMVGHAGFIMHQGMDVIVDQLSRGLGNLDKVPLIGWINVAGIFWHRLQRTRRKENIDNPDRDLVAPGLTPTLLCTDPRDRVCGMLGILNPDQATKTLVDYEKSVEEVYIDFAAAVIEHTGSLDMLWRCSNTQMSERTLPSWVLDHREDSAAVPLQNFNVSSLMTSLEKPRIVSSSRLLVAGLCLDHVDGLGAINPIDWENLDPQTPPGVVQGSGQVDHKYGDFNGLKIAFWSTFHFEESQNVEEPLSFSRTQLEAMCPTSSKARAIQQLFDVNKDFRVSGQSLESFFDNEPSETVGTSEHTASWNSMFHDTLSWPTYRRITCTKEGRLGWVPANARKCDAIFALRGSGPLAVLRKHNDVWRCV